jgi:ABC-type branched-subunit amino acid transport system substrate-binding protein
LTACPPPENTPRGTITLGSLLDVTGDLAQIGSEELNAVKLAVEEINRADGVLDSDLKLENKDPALDVDVAKSAAQALVSAGAVAVIGSTASSITLAAASILAPARIVQVSAVSTSPAITTYSDDGYLFRTCPSDALQGKLLAQRAYAKGLRKAATIYVPGAYGEGLSASFRAAFEGLGGTVSSTNAYTEGQSSYAALLTTVYADSPDSVVLVAYPADGAQVVKDYLSAFSQRGTHWFFSDGLADAAFITLVGASSFTFQHEGSQPAVFTGATATAFAAAFQAKYGAAPSDGFTGVQNAYDAVYLVALAMAAAGKSDGVSIRDKMAAVSGPPGTKYTAAQFKEAVAAVKAGNDIDYDGASGPVDMDANGDVVGPYDVWKVSGGAFTYVERGVNP